MAKPLASRFGARRAPARTTKLIDHRCPPSAASRSAHSYAKAQRPLFSMTARSEPTLGMRIFAVLRSPVVTSVPRGFEPRQVRLVPGACLLLAGEERVGLVQDERVGRALSPGHVGDRQFGCVDPGVDVLLPSLASGQSKARRPGSARNANRVAELARAARGSPTVQSSGTRRGRASRARSRAAQSAARAPKPASPRAPSRGGSAAARSADSSDTATGSSCCGYIRKPRPGARGFDRSGGR